MKVVDGFASLFPGDPLLPLPHRVHVAVVHALAQQVLLQLEGARGGGVAGPPVPRPPVTLAVASLATSATSAAAALSHTSKLMSSLLKYFSVNSKYFCQLLIIYHYLDVVVDRAGLAVGGGGDPAVAGLRGLQILPGAVAGVAAGQGAARTRPWTRQVLGIRIRAVGAFWHSFVPDILEGIYDLILKASSALIALRPISALHFKLDASNFVLCFKHKSFKAS